MFPKTGGRSYARGMQLFNRREFSRAAVEFDGLLAREKRPGSLDAKLARFYSAEAHAKVGISCYKTGDLIRARGEFDRAVHVQGHYPDLYAYLGILDAREGRWAEAKGCLDQSLALSPTQREALAARIVVRERLGDREAADRDWGRLRELGLAKPHLLRYQPRLPFAPHCLEELKGSRRQTCLATALEHYDRGDWRQALVELEGALRECPGYADLHYRRGLLLSELNRGDEAIAAFEAALAIHPRFLNALLAQGLSWLALSRWPEAAAPLARALEIEPHHADVAYAHAVAVFCAGDPDEAWTSLRAALAANPRFWRARVALALVECALGRRDQALAELETALAHHLPQGPLFTWERELEPDGKSGAVAYWTAALASHPDYPDLHFQLGMAYLHLGDLEGARDAFQNAVERHPGYAEAHCGLGKVEVRAGFPHRAVPHLARALDACPGWADVWCLLAEARFASGELAAAAADFEQSLALNPGYVDALLGLAMVRSGQRRAEEARGLYERVLRQAPGHPVAEARLAGGGAAR
jgi:tetratricopeptide (TPR) repeat protein